MHVEYAGIPTISSTPFCQSFKLADSSAHMWQQMSFSAVLHVNCVIGSRGLVTSTPAASPSAPGEDDGQSEGKKTGLQALHPVWNWPNVISMARLISGPGIGYLILQSQWEAAIIGFVASGISDWLDGFIARRYSQGSVVGSYLDPLADKVLICCTVGTLAYKGLLYAPLAALIIGRDIFLVAGAFVLRFRSLNWTWPGYSEFFRTTAVGKAIDDVRPKPEGHASHTDKQRYGQEGLNSARGGMVSQPAAFVQPLYVSKVNTVAQILLVASCMSSSSLGYPPYEVILGLGGVTAGLTMASGFAYLKKHQSRTKP